MFIGIFPKFLKIFLMCFFLRVIIVEFPYFLPDPVCIFEYSNLKLPFHHGSLHIFHHFVGVSCQLFWKLAAAFCC